MAVKSGTGIQPAGEVEICILAGGLSSRMGFDKRQIPLAGGVSMLKTIEHVAQCLNVPIRVVRKDRKPGLGPLGGVDTALHRGRASGILFLACDMPLITPQFLRWFLKKARPHRAAFTFTGSKVGFPFFLTRDCRMAARSELVSGRLSLTNFAKTLEARLVVPPVRNRHELVNLNTPEDLANLLHKTPRGSSAA